MRSAYLRPRYLFRAAGALLTTVLLAGCGDEFDAANPDDPMSVGAISLGATGTYSLAASLPTLAYYANLNLLPNGNVLHIDWPRNAAIYDSTANRWSPAAPPPFTVGDGNDAVDGRLPDGRIVFTGPTTVSIYAPASNTWSTASGWGADSWAVRGEGAEETLEEAEEVAAEVVKALVKSDVQVETPLAHTTEGTEEVAQSEPVPFHRVAVDLAHAVAIVVACPLLALGVDGEARPVVIAQVVVRVPLVRVHVRLRLGHAPHDRLDRLRGAPKHLAQKHFAGLASDHPEDRRAILLEGAVPVEAVTPPPRRVLGVRMPTPFVPASSFAALVLGPLERARSHEGSGIGLALLKELVKLHGGRVRVQSAGRVSPVRATARLARLRARHPRARRASRPLDPGVGRHGSPSPRAVRGPR